MNKTILNYGGEISFTPLQVIIILTALETMKDNFLKFEISEHAFIKKEHITEQLEQLLQLFNKIDADIKSNIKKINNEN